MLSLWRFHSLTSCPWISHRDPKKLNEIIHAIIIKNADKSKESNENDDKSMENLWKIIEFHEKTMKNDETSMES